MLLAGGIGLFLLGMWLMTEGLKLASGSALRTLLESWTRAPSRGFAAGFFITALVQSSSATTVATIGFVNAGLLTLSQAIWVVIGANVGTTMTGWIVALLGIKIQMGTLAMPLIGIGMLVRLTGRTGSRASGIGQAIAGFGTFFLGIGVLQEGFANLTPLIATLRLDDAGLAGMALSLLLGAVLTVVTQSSSAAVAITLTATTMGSIPPELAAAVVIGTNIGTTSTAVFAGLSATPAAKRVATAHVLFNLLTACVAFILISPLIAASYRISALFAGEADMPAMLAVFHTLFNLIGAMLMWPVVRRLTSFLHKLYVTPAEEIATPRHLDRTLLDVPDLALRALARELIRMTHITFRLARNVVEQSPSPLRRTIQDEAEGLLLLGREIKLYTDRLAARSSSSDIAARLSDLIRAAQHLIDLASAVAPRSAADDLPATAMSLPQWKELQQAALDCLVLSGTEHAELLGGPESERLHGRVEETYQLLKKGLLQAAATGALPLTVMDRALTRAQSIRRLAGIALKAQRRLSSWVADDDWERNDPVHVVSQ